jgi:HTH-type transcriptional regulator, competence development regulator
MHNTNLSLGTYLRSLRKKVGQTLHQVSRGADIDSPLLSKIETAERLPTVDQVIRLAKYYSIPEEDLKVKLIAEKIIKEHGLDKTTYSAVRLVEQIINSKKSK